MPRSERPLDQDESTLTQFAADLRKLREAAGRPPYRALAVQAHFSSTTLSEAANGRALPSLSVTLAYVEACHGNRQEWETRWHAVAAEMAASTDSDEPEETNGSSVPYVGLSAFQPEDSDRFFGRDRLTGELVAKAREHRFLAVFGPSGSGKSSLLRAGLVATVRKSDRPTMLLTPGPHPVEECAVRLAALTGQPPNQLLTELLDDSAALHLRVLQAMIGREEDTDLLIVVDQFEEIFTLCQDSAERDRFITTLIAAASAPTSRTRVVLGVRADFYSRCVQHPELAEALRDTQVAVGPMSSQELRQAVTQPAVLAGCTVAGPLLAAVVADATGQPGALPLVSHAMVETWRRRSGRSLTLDGYLAAGGIQHALAHTAEAAYRTLSPAQQDHARALFLRLTALGEGTEDTKRRISRDELDQGPDIEVVLETLARQRLLNLDRDSVEITHEAIIRCWPRLRAWLGEDRSRLRTHRQLTEATGAWVALDRDPHALYRGTRLAMALDWAAVDDSQLTSRERQFLDTSRDAEAAEQRAARRRTVRLRQLVGLLTVLLVVAATSVVLAVDSRSSAIQQRNIAIARKVSTDAVEMREKNPSLAAQLSLAAYQLAPTDDTRDHVMSMFATPYTSRLVGHTSDLVSLSFAPDSQVLATASWDRTARLWDVRDAHRPIELAVLHQPEELRAVAFGQGGRILATVSARSVRLWDVTNRRAPTELSTVADQPGTPTWVAFSPDGAVMATGHTDGTARLWNVSDPRHPRLLAALPGHTNEVTSVVFSANGHMVATTGDSTGRLWEVTDPEAPRLLGVLRGHTDTVTSAAFSPDGRTVATGSWDHTARVWDISTPALPQGPAVLLGHPAIIWSIAFSPDGRTLVSVGGVTLLWDVSNPANPKRVSTIPGGVYAVAFSPDGTMLANADRLLELRELSLVTHDDVVSSLTFRPDGRVLASSSWDNTARLWEVTDHQALRPLATLPGHTKFVRSVAFSPDGHTLVTASEDTIVRVWNVAEPRTPQLRATITPNAGEVAGAVFSPDGHTLAVWAHQMIGLWDLADPDSPRPLSRITGLPVDVIMASFRPDGRILATSAAEGTSLRLWNISDPHSPQELPFPFRADSLTDGVFSPDNRTMAALRTTDKTVWLLDISDIQQPRKLTELPTSIAGIYSVTFSGDGRRLAGGGADNKAWLWDVSDPARPSAPTLLTGHTNVVPAVAFSPDSHTLATGSNDYTLRLWETSLDKASTRICNSAYPRITREEWTRYFPAVDFNPPCPTS
jgi:WD40 repeat protein